MWEVTIDYIFTEGLPILASAILTYWAIIKRSFSLGRSTRVTKTVKELLGLKEQLTKASIKHTELDSFILEKLDAYTNKKKIRIYSILCTVGLFLICVFAASLFFYAAKLLNDAVAYAIVGNSDIWQTSIVICKVIGASALGACVPMAVKICMDLKHHAKFNLEESIIPTTSAVDIFIDSLSAEELIYLRRKTKLPRKTRVKTKTEKEVSDA